jgi:hypothetical protein
LELRPARIKGTIEQIDLTVNCEQLGLDADGGGSFIAGFGAEHGGAFIAEAGTAPAPDLEHDL